MDAKKNTAKGAELVRLTSVIHDYEEEAFPILPRRRNSK
jgi:hypothetical protein